MSALKLAMIDKQVAQHIRMNGRMTDQVGMKLAMKFVEEALKDSTIKDAAQEYGFTAEDLSLVYASMIEGLRPNPCIECGGPMLAATLAFMEPFRIESFLRAAHYELEGDISSQERRKMIMDKARAHAQLIWNTHTMARGEAPFSIDPTGTGLPSADSEPADHCSRLIPFAHAVTGFLICALIIWIFHPYTWAYYVSAIPLIYGLSNLRNAIFDSQEALNNKLSGKR